MCLDSTTYNIIYIELLSNKKKIRFIEISNYKKKYKKL